MAEETEAKPCSNPGCNQPGTNACSACKTSLYYGPTCQTADWAHHKEECPVHLRKVGKANFDKAFGLDDNRTGSKCFVMARSLQPSLSN